MTKIYLKKTVVDGNTKIDLIGENLPKNFLGMATDLKILNDAGEGIALEKVELGDAFKSLPEQFQPIFLYKADQTEAKIVFGLVLKANNLAEVKDGVLASFSFKNEVNLAFEKPILSIFDQGRKDLEDVSWVNMEIIAKNQLVAQVNQSNKDVETEVLDNEENATITDILALVEEKSPINWLGRGETAEVDGYGQAFWIGGLGLLIVAGGLAIIFRKRL